MRRGLALIAAFLVSLAGWWLPVELAYAAGDDSFDQVTVNATLGADGYLYVTETVVLRFGSSSGRHGLQVQLVTREPDGEDYDLVYKIDQVSVLSSSGAPNSVQLTNNENGRNGYLQVRVGDPNFKIYAPTATYVLSYRVLGLLRSPDGVSQLYWDVTGSSTPLIERASVRVDAPGGAQAVDCWVGVPSSTSQTRCAGAKIGTDGSARFTSQAIRPGQLLTVAVKLAPGAVTNAAPIREPNADKANAEKMAVVGTTAFVTFLVSLAGAIVARRIGRRRLRRLTSDLRFVELPPGVLPSKGESTPELPFYGELEIPVAFSPPRISVAEAGYLLDASVDIRDTTATLVQLAVSGAISLRTEGASQVELLDRAQAPDRTSRALLRELFPQTESDEPRSLDLSEPGTLRSGHRVVTSEVEQAAVEGGWYSRSPVGRDQATDPFLAVFLGMIFFVVGAVMLMAFAGSIGVGLVVFLLALTPLIGTIAVTQAEAKAKVAELGQRSGLGRALTDQVEGFRTYLATAEAEQLRFEEGEDIFSRYLPWAVAFDLTDRWTQVCQQLVEIGRLSAAAPGWYTGTNWSLTDMSHQFAEFKSAAYTASLPAPSLPTFSSADSGFGSSGSAFGSGSHSGSRSSSGGGFSGGGSGGSNMSSW